MKRDLNMSWIWKRILMRRTDLSRKLMTLSYLMYLRTSLTTKRLQMESMQKLRTSQSQDRPCTSRQVCTSVRIDRQIGALAHRLGMLSLNTVVSESDDTVAFPAVSAQIDSWKVPGRCCTAVVGPRCIFAGELSCTARGGRFCSSAEGLGETAGCTADEGL